MPQQLFLRGPRHTFMPGEEISDKLCSSQCKMFNIAVNMNFPCFILSSISFHAYKDTHKCTHSYHGNPKCQPSVVHTVCLSARLPLFFFHPQCFLPYTGTWNLIFCLKNTYIGTIPNVLGEDFEGNALRVVLLFF